MGTTCCDRDNRDIWGSGMISWGTATGWQHGQLEVEKKCCIESSDCQGRTAPDHTALFISFLVKPELSITCWRSGRKRFVGEKVVETFPGPKLKAESQKGTTDLLLTRTPDTFRWEIKGNCGKPWKKKLILPTPLDLLLSVQQAEAGSVSLPCGRWSTLQSHILAV